MEKDRVEGIGHQVKGALKESFGRIVGDAKLVADGAAEREAGVAQTASANDGQVAGIDTDRILGVGHQMKGALKRGLGKIIGNPTLQADGAAEQVAGRAQNAVGSARDDAREVIESQKAPAVAGDRTTRVPPV